MPRSIGSGLFPARRSAHVDGWVFVSGVLLFFASSCFGDPLPSGMGRGAVLEGLEGTGSGGLRTAAHPAFSAICR